MILELIPAEFTSRFARLEREAKRVAIENADAIVAVSQNSKSDILMVYPAIPEEKITVIHHGVSLAGGFPEDDFPGLAARWRLPIGAGEYLLFVGNRGSYKNFDLLVQLFNRHREIGAFVVCVGGEMPGPDRMRLEQMGVADRCAFIVSASDDELRVLYRNARALVFPSRYEGFGLPLLEAMANDCPVLCSDIAVFHEICCDAALYFDPSQSSSLAEVVAALDAVNREAMVQRGRLNVRRFSWDEAAKKLVALYQTL
jgi:glycosyltransferase involved in cell wall biosynthesis